MPNRLLCRLLILELGELLRGFDLFLFVELIQALKGRLQKSQDHAEKVEKPQSQVNFESWKEDARVAKEELTALNRLL